MKIGIYDVDSKIPNLALMKLSAHHKACGDETEMYYQILHGTYDRIYASKIFDFSDDSLITDDMVVGGTGWDLFVNLDPEIDQMKPDYSIYNYPHSIGFTMRGCRLKCDFCVVPRKEGSPYSENTIDDIWTQRNSNFIVLLDNDFFGNPDWRDRIKELNEFKLRVNFNQGINIRNITEEQAAALASVKYRNLHNTGKQIFFAWDDRRHEKLIHRGIKRCQEAGIKPYQMGFYVLIGFNSSHQDNLHRVEVLKEYGCDPYVMPYNKEDDYQRRFARWVNHKAVFNSVSWDSYRRVTNAEIAKSDSLDNLSLPWG